MKIAFTILLLAGIALAQDQPRVRLNVKSNADPMNTRRHQFMEMEKEFQQNCPKVSIAVPINHNYGSVDYVVILNRIQLNMLTQTYRMDVVNKDSNLVAGQNTGKIRDGVAESCNRILADWQKQQTPQAAAAPAQPQQNSQGVQDQDQAASDQPQAEPQTVQLGQTPDQVRTALGQPDKVVNLGAKQIYLYKDLKVTFVSEKVSDVQ